MKTYSPKSPSETITLSIDFTKDLSVGESLTGAATVSIGTYSFPPDPGAGNIPVGAAQTQGNEVLQSVTQGLNGTTYWIEATSKTTAGQQLTIGGLLPVMHAYLQN